MMFPKLLVWKSERVVMIVTRKAVPILPATVLAVLEAAVVGEKDQDGMFKPKAYVVLRHGNIGDAAMERELKMFVKDKIAPYKHPRWISFVSELPKTATGKTQRFKLRSTESTIE